MNIIIIDDEPLVLQSVADQVRKMGFGFDRIDCAADTGRADELLSYNKYDIFLCDIVMPGEDGISFAKRILRTNKDCKFIFLTAHADYEYMKEAISLQSFDYILQPVAEDELRKVIESAITQLKIEQKNNQLLKLGELFENDHEDILDGNAMRYLLNQTDNSTFLRHLIADRTGYKESELKMIPALIQIVKSDKHWGETERNLLRSIYYNVIDEITSPLHSKNIIVLRSDKMGSFILLLCFNEREIDIDNVKSVLEYIRLIFSKSLKTSIALYYSGMCRFDNLKESFKYIIQEQSNNVSGDSGVYLVGQLSSLDIDEYSLESQKQEWKAILEKDELIRFKESVIRFVNHKRRSDDLNKDVLMRIHQAVSELILGYMVSNNINSKDVFDDELSYMDFMYCWDTSDGFLNAVGRIVMKIYNLGDGGDVVTDITNYISQNIGKEIYVSEIADYIGMNPEYLTRFFKKEKGVSLKKYIDSQKLTRAKHLLENTDESVTEIANSVGYSNYVSFTRAFKQHMGVAPSEYRKKDEGQKL